MTKKVKEDSPKRQQRPKPGYVPDQKLKNGVLAFRLMIKNIAKEVCEKDKLAKEKKAKNLLEVGDKFPQDLSKVFIEVVFKNVPSNSKTYIHNVVLPHHWRLTLEPEHYDIALFVPHIKPKTEAQKIQFNKDRDLDIDNTHSYYKDLFESKLDKSWRDRVSRIITSKELATEFNTYQKIDRLSKTYDLFIGDKKLMSNKFNALPRRLGRRFWVRERKVPLIVKLNGENLNERFAKVMSTEPFYVVGNSSTEKIQIGLSNQKASELFANIKVFLAKLYDTYAEDVRFIKLRSQRGPSLPLYADLTPECPKEVSMRKKKIKRKAVVDEFNFLPGHAKVAVRASGAVKIMRPSRRTKRKAVDDESSTVDTATHQAKKRVKS